MSFCVNSETHLHCLWLHQLYFLLWITETRGHRRNDIRWPLCYYDDGALLNLHRIYLQWILLCSIWTIRTICLRMPWSIMQVIINSILYDKYIERKKKLNHISYYWTFRDAGTTGLIKVRRTYPFGLDPMWHGTRSELPFLNSLKMKMSILLGVAQMNLGIILSYCNAKHFRNDINIR